MEPHFFRIRAIPSDHHPHAAELAGAYVHVWVFETDFEAARERVLAFLADCHWRLEEWLNEFQITDAQIARLNSAEAANYTRACNSGISADFHSWKSDAQASDGAA